MEDEATTEATTEAMSSSSGNARHCKCMEPGRGCLHISLEPIEVLNPCPTTELRSNATTSPLPETNMEVDNPLFVEDNSIPGGRCQLP